MIKEKINNIDRKIEDIGDALREKGASKTKQFTFPTDGSFIENSVEGEIRGLKINGDIKQEGTPTIENPIEIQTVSGNYEIKFSNLDNTQENSKLIDTSSNPLYSQNDYYYQENGEWYVHNEWGKIILNGNENWLLGATNSGMRAFQTTFENNSIGRIAGQFISNRFKQKTSADWTQEGFINVSATSNATYLFISTTKANSVAELKTFLSQNNTEVVYKLQTPTNIKITNETLINQLNELLKLKTYDGGTNITITSEDIPPIIEIQYAEKDSKFKLSEMPQAILDIPKGEDLETELTEQEEIITRINTKIDERIEGGGSVVNNYKIKFVHHAGNPEEWLPDTYGITINYDGNDIEVFNFYYEEYDGEEYFYPTFALLETFDSDKVYKIIEILNNIYDFKQVTNFSWFFAERDNLKRIPLINTSEATVTNAMFKACYNLEEIPLLNIGKVTDTSYMFGDCENLKAVPIFDTKNVEEIRYMFDNCPSLTNESLNNILEMCINATKTNRYYKTLMNIGLTQEQAQKCTTLSNYQQFLSAGWTTGY